MPDSNLVFYDLKYTPEPEARKEAMGPERTRWQPWSVLILSGGNFEALFESTEHYTNRSDAIHAIDLVARPGANVYRREHEHGDVELRLASWFTPPAPEQS